MIEDSKVSKGACGSCDCAEFAPGKVGSKCDDCGCPTSKHRDQENSNDLYINQIADTGAMKGISKFIRGRVNTFLIWYADY